MYDCFHTISIIFIGLVLLSMLGCASKQEVVRTTNCSAKFEYRCECECDCDKKDIVDLLDTTIKEGL